MVRSDPRHWWSGRWGARRRDVYLRAEDDQFAVEARAGGQGGDTRTWHPPTEEDAVQLVRSLLEDQVGWRELSVRP